MSNTKLISDLLKNAIALFNKRFKEELSSCEHSDNGLSPYHMEGDVYTHTMLVLHHFVNNYDTLIGDYLYDFEVLMWSCLLHDVGKPFCSTLREDKGKLKKYMSGHELVSSQMAISFLTDIGEGKELISDVSQTILYHTLAHNNLIITPNKNLNKFVKILHTCDEAGRIHMRLK